MNIEEEREAFEKIFAEKFPATNRSAKDGGYDAQSQKSIAWEGWQLAKAHAEETAKPEQECNLECSNGWCFLSTHSDCGDYYRITSDMGKDECLAYAERNNYRIVE